jgi:Flp pilus assembly pilin Flp
MKWCYMIVYRRSELAQGLVEYALVIILVSVAVVLALSLIAPTIGNVFSDVGDVMEGV